MQSDTSKRISVGSLYSCRSGFSFYQPFMIGRKRTPINPRVNLTQLQQHTESHNTCIFITSVIYLVSFPGPLQFGYTKAVTVTFLRATEKGSGLGTRLSYTYLLFSFFMATVCVMEYLGDLFLPRTLERFLAGCPRSSPLNTSPNCPFPRG